MEKPKFKKELCDWGCAYLDASWDNCNAYDAQHIIVHDTGEKVRCPQCISEFGLDCELFHGE